MSRNETLGYREYWEPHPDLDPTLAKEAHKAIARLPLSHLIHPVDGEIFSAPEAAFDRLQNYAMSRGFCVVARSSDRNKEKTQIVRVRWQCIHHNLETANKRGLEKHVTYDSEGKISSERKRENTKIMGKGCNWGMGVSYKAISAGSTTKEWFLRISNASHNGHEMVPNPLSYIAHLQRQPEWKTSLALATTHRLAQISHKSSQRILDASDEGLEIDRTSYYHINRRPSRLGESQKRNELDEEIIASNKAIIESIRSAREMASGFAKRLPQRPATERWEPAKRLPTAAESAASVAKDREDKEERLRKAREADRKEEEARKEAVFRSHAAAALEIEAAKEQDEILEDTRTTRSAITIDDEDEEVTIDDLPLPSTAPAALGGRSKRARASTVNYRELAGITTRHTREEIERLNQEAERKKRENAAEMALRSPVKKKSRFVDAKAFERK